MTTQKLSDDAHKELESKLQHLVDLAFQEGLLAAIEAARKQNDPYLLDALHDMLVDRLYDELITRHTLEELK
ncbi:hypothetical protein A3C91_00535 [Candidatus Azambacteria bacterium RIFCSPHIGHO2_02_FULL_52_12]|uniref:Uncharacterized protein n=1 Tax=Candidatus Azambacteria bacterium RIFCSPLOWO2_01_FULL_46_25 TaxID=1797298 RepID=A0A1F5BTR1_9BACT|nr:MAG: hypothetical protein A3C91_00535 [Candidatus Azambacteria bacterium RIFCSPHIGHO2_02_FULL_52_12]OGD33960.1 MAG: hypothetical protein A2988_00515 [Candidatus Azambacteria bacterium RIFCSPLOWO2_01_FULL_46_25]OGD37646.1 MAG: hypothetical protein A2850_04590 [Candidatus Azambacteria bacterium RIFCSPHIGHO2_01_FULL_51_74]